MVDKYLTDEIIDYFKANKYLLDEVKTLEKGEAAYALREAWKRIYGRYPEDKALAVLWAKSCLETGWWKYIHCYNFGNIKKKRETKWSPDDGQFFTMYKCSEILKGKEEWFNPPHLQTHFCAYETVEDGAEHYIRFVSQKKRYAKAWKEVINGDPKAYSHELRVAGYYTASETLYTKGVVRLFDAFMKDKDNLLSWEPEEDDADTVPAPTFRIQEDDIDTRVDNDIPEPYTDTDIHTVDDDVTEVTEVEVKAVIKAKPKVGKNAGKNAGLFMFLAVGATSIWAWFQGLF